MFELALSRSAAVVHPLERGLSSGALGEKGKLHGESIQTAPDASSLLEDAKEEISLLFKERMEKRLARRSMATQKRSRNQKILIEKLRDLMEQMPDLYKNVKMKALIETVNGSFPKNAEQLLQLLERFTEDPSLQFAALQVLEGDAQAGGEKKTSRLAVISDAVTTLLANKGEAVRAGLNVSRTAADFEGRLNTDIQGLRDSYRDSVLDYGGVTETYRALIKRHGEGAFETARKFLMKALSADYSAQGPSIDRSRLKAIMDDMYALKLLGGIHRQCLDIMHTMRRLYGQLESRSGRELMGRILDIKDQSWVQANEIAGLPVEMKIEGIGNQIYLLREVHEVIREIPEKAFADSSQREQLLSVAKEALEQLFNKEQEA